jgi:hypothetical protein
MSQSYSPREVQLESDDRPQIKGLVEEINSRLQDLAALVSRVTEMPLTPGGVVRSFEIREEAEASDSGIMILPLPTDPPMLACGYYTDGEYTKIVVPCTEIVLPSGTVISL